MGSSNKISQALSDIRIDINTNQLGFSEGDSIKIECIKSTDFVIGKQTNFNGPVTIINCDFLERDLSNCENEAEGFRIPEERIVIRDKVLSASANTKIKDQAEKDRINNFLQYAKVWLVKFLTRDFIKIPIEAWIVFIFSVLVGIITAVSRTTSSWQELVWPIVEFLAGDVIKIPVGIWIVIFLGVIIGINAYCDVKAGDIIKTSVRMWNVIFMVLMGAIIAISSYLVLSPKQPLESYTWKENLPRNLDRKITASNGKSYNFITRAEWGALKPAFQTELELPVPYVVISHTAGKMCYNKVTGMMHVLDIQKYHMSQGKGDIAYNFLVGGDGNIYEGRGWNYRNPAEGFVNNKSMDINFIGDFSVYDSPTKPQVEAVKALIEFGVNNSIIAEDYSLIAASTTKATLSPGKNVYNIIKTWPRFEANPKDRIRGENDTYKETDQLESTY